MFKTNQGRIIRSLKALGYRKHDIYRSPRFTAPFFRSPDCAVKWVLLCCYLHITWCSEKIKTYVRLNQQNILQNKCMLMCLGKDEGLFYQIDTLSGNTASVSWVPNWANTHDMCALKNPRHKIIKVDCPCSPYLVMKRYLYNMK